MHFEISRAVKPGRSLTRAQMSSGYFAEEPRIGAFTIRRGSAPLKVTMEQMTLLQKDIKRGLISQSIVVKQIDDDGLVITVASGWDVHKNQPIFDSAQMKEAGKKIEESLNQKLESGEETLKSLEAVEVVPVKEEVTVVAVSPQIEEDRKFIEEVQKVVETLPPDQTEFTTEPKKKGRKPKKDDKS
jgi:hypothetical protein